MRVAVVHDYFCNLGGSDTVARALYDLFPNSELYTLLVYARNREAEVLRGIDVHTSFLQSLPFADRTHQPFLPLMPLAIESFDLRGYDLILSSSHTVAHGVIPPPNALHLCYCHTPMRYAWDGEQQYLSELPTLARPWMRVLMHRMRQWDVAAAARVDHFIVNSNFVARRIEKFYRRPATVIPPPVDTDFYTLQEMPRREYYLVAGRLTGYKRIDLVVDAFRSLDKQLVVIGEGPEREQLERRASSNVTFLGATTRETLREHFSQARALIFPGLEDFGIVPVEAMATGCPVIAYGAGGALDTVREGETGVLFCEQTADGVREAIARFEKMTFDAHHLRAHALNFSADKFDTRIRGFIEAKWNEFHRV
ncbi:MAG TPA: glycosyltransferase [Anaerolineae bacterium]|nr:glycosyltransferase [Anaerolineae bacterium]